MRQTSSEVKPGHVGLVLGWVTSRVVLVLFFLYFKSNLFLATNILFL